MLFLVVEFVLGIGLFCGFIMFMSMLGWWVMKCMWLLLGWKWILVGDIMLFLFLMSEELMGV